jgi:hypothetical protein
MRTEMNDRTLARYLGLDREEFDWLKLRLTPEKLEDYRLLAEVAVTLEQYATRYNRPPKATEESDAALMAAQSRAFARLEQNAQHGAGHRQERGDRPLRPIMGVCYLTRK